MARRHQRSGLDNSRASGPVAPLVFVHVPKAAGTSLKDIIGRVYAGRPVLYFLPRTGALERFRALPAAARGRCAVLAGHEPFGFHDAFDGCGVRPAVITVLRDPVARVLSLFGYIHREPDHPEHARFVERGVTLAQVYDEATLPAFDNHQVRFLAGPGAFEKPFGGLTRGDLEQAKRNLAEGCRAFGLRERFDESLGWFRRELDWPAVQPTELNRSPEGAEQVGKADRALIEKHNELDGELYDSARALFDERVGGG